jgi:hypothetical protein
MPACVGRDPRNPLCYGISTGLSGWTRLLRLDRNLHKPTRDLTPDPTSTSSTQTILTMSQATRRHPNEASPFKVTAALAVDVVASGPGR